MKSRTQVSVSFRARRAMQTAMQRSRVYATPAVQRKLRGTRGSSQLVKASERVHVPDTTNLDEGKAETVSNLVSKKEQSGKSFTQIANEVGLTNGFTTNLFFRQARLSDAAAPKLQQAVPTLSESDIEVMKQAPMRDWEDDVLKEPNTYRLYEAITHYSKAIKSLVNEECGDGIMSAIDFYMSVERIIGAHGEPRVKITFNGKHLPFIDQWQENDTS